MNNTLIIGVIVTGVALLFCIIATAIPYWWSSDLADIGLFRGCIDLRQFGGNTCSELKNPADWVEATRAMMIIAILALGGGLLLAILFGFIMKDKQILAFISAVLCFIGGGATLLGVIIYGAKLPDDLYDLAYGKGTLHASFGLAIIAAIVAFIAGVIIFLSKGRNV